MLSGDYLIPSGGWGGFSENLAAGQDWSSFRGIRLAWYASQPTRPASPTAGDDIKVELKDGGPDGEHSELWAATFKDNWSHRRQPLEDRRPAVLAVHARAATSRATRRRATAPST